METENAYSSKRIAKNTLLLYVRMLVTLAITLYTSRMVLAILGQEDFGIYNVIGGVVVLFSFLTNAMTNSTQRFFNYYLGLKEPEKIQSIFNTATFAHLTIFFLVFFLSETVGLWFVENQLNIPIERMNAARWTYQMSILSTLLNIIVVPYRASFIATEKMSIFAYMSIFEVVLKLLIVFILPISSIDRLILYSILFCLISLFNYVLYQCLSWRYLSFTRFKFVWNKQEYKEMMTFSSWYLFGGIAMVGSKQGVNILINIFFGVAVNAAVGIANQVRTAIYGFVASFQTAFNPQIVKLYASGERIQLIKLVFNSTKYSYYLLFILSFPVIYFCDNILAIWLEDVPDFTSIFTKLVIIATFFEVLSAPLWTAIGATGQVKKYQIWVSIIILFDIPLVYVALKIGLSPILAFWVNFIVSGFAYLFRLIYIRKIVNYSIHDYIKCVVYPCLTPTLLIILISHLLFRNDDVSILYTIFSFIIIVLISILSIFFIGFNRKEKEFLYSYIKEKMHLNLR